MQGRAREARIPVLAPSVVGGRGSEASGDVGAADEPHHPCGVAHVIEDDPSFQRSIHSVLAARIRSIDPDMHGTARPWLGGAAQVLDADARCDRESCERKCTGRLAVSFTCKNDVIRTSQIL